MPLTTSWLASLAGIVICASVNAATSRPPAAYHVRHDVREATYEMYGGLAEAELLRNFYHAGYWRLCALRCSEANADFGADALTETLYLHWQTTRDSNVIPFFRALEKTSPNYEPCRGIACKQWSDVPEWDSVAASREYEVIGSEAALAKAAAAYRSVENSDVYARGACPAVRYQHPFGKGGGLKTLETEANAIKAALLLYRFTKSPAFLLAAIRRYSAVRRYFLDRQVPLYSVYLFDDGIHCIQLPQRFFASVNGLMIGNGLMLWRFTGNSKYRRQAVSTALAIDQHLADARGIYENLQAENDVGEPLVEAMYDLAATGARSPRDWILRNAQAAISSCSSYGRCGRFFGGPPSDAPITAWQANGRLALLIAAADLAPKAAPTATNEWKNARFVSRAISKLPASIAFRGSGIALVGTLGEICCEAGHARVFLDGKETFDRSGIWQNKSSSGRSIPNTVLFAWQWLEVRAHTLRIYPGNFNPKEGGSFFHLRGYLVR
jgi:hypothetical protein